MTFEKTVPALTLARARALLTELIVGFSKRHFQKKLDDLVRSHVAKIMRVPESAVTPCMVLNEVFLLDGRKELALTVQREVLPRYGFDGTEKGVQQMVRAIQPFMCEVRIWEQTETIKKKLKMPSKTCALAEDSSDSEGEPHPKYLRREKAVALQTELLQEYSQPEVQAKLREVMNLLDKHARLTERKRIIREVQAAVMPRYGFDADDSGIDAMRKAFEPWNDDEEVQSLGLAMEEQLTHSISNAMEQGLLQLQHRKTARA